jgi:hypothetical protein
LAKADDGQRLVTVIKDYDPDGSSSGALHAVWDAETSTVTVTNTNDIPVIVKSDLQVLKVLY